MNNQNFRIYPAYTFSTSRTYFAWVKLTAADIHGLRSERGFEGQNLYFHLNHPIRFVSIVAPIVQIEDLFGKFVLITLDDGSGAIIHVKVTRLAARIANAIDCPSNTTVDNLNVVSKLGTFDISVDDTILSIGTVVKVKCTISDWKGMKQLELKRIHTVRSTAEEVGAWEEIVRWKKDVLSSPWLLSKRQLEELSANVADERKQRKDQEFAAEERRRQRAEKRIKQAERMKTHAEKAEKKRRAEEVMMNAGALI